MQLPRFGKPKGIKSHWAGDQRNEFDVIRRTQAIKMPRGSWNLEIVSGPEGARMLKRRNEGIKKKRD